MADSSRTSADSSGDREGWAQRLLTDLKEE
jgi:hypothetical protein